MSAPIPPGRGGHYGTQVNSRLGGGEHRARKLQRTVTIDANTPVSAPRGREWFVS